jgi:hypothetical protein
MATSAVCLDQNQNAILCSDPDCTYGDCGSTAVQQTSGSLCLDQNQNPIACTDPNCTFGDCTASAPGSVGALAATSSSSGGTSLPAGTTGILANLATAATNIATQATAPKTTLATPLGTFSTGSLSSIVPLLIAAILVFLIYRSTKKPGE